MTTLKTNHGEYAGESIDSIVRREYGRGAYAMRSADSNSPHWGQVLKNVRNKNSSHVLARIIWVEESGEVRHGD